MTASEERLRRRHRLSLDREFQAIFQNKCSVAGALLVLYGKRNGLDYNRLGLVVSRRLGPATVRARFKRLVREAFRKSRDRQEVGWDWVVLPRLPKKTRDKAKKEVPTAPCWTYDAIAAEWRDLVGQIHRRSARKQGTPRKPSRPESSIDE